VVVGLRSSQALDLQGDVIEWSRNPEDLASPGPRPIRLLLLWQAREHPREEDEPAVEEQQAD
jgi:hypothetical protein